MKKITTVILLFLFGITAAAFAAGDGTGESQPAKHYQGSLFSMTEKGLFSVELMAKGQGLVMGDNTVDIIVHDKDNREVVGADVSVTPWMPEHGHGIAEKAVVTERGGGLYSVSSLMLPMGGKWELRIGVKAGGQEDTAVFGFQVAQGSGAETMSGASADPDLSSTRFSDHKAFRVSFTSRLDPIVIGRIHSWELQVETPEGMPVTGARITIDGGMPVHGHGLPTEPAVTQELGDGRYLVGGMKFSMPGWWTVHFRIQAKDREDAVTFNLMLQ